MLAFGDSLVAGYGLQAADAFPARLEEVLRRTRLDARVLGAGVSGETAPEGARRLPGTLARLSARPDLAIVELGANDLLCGLDPRRTRAALDEMLGELERCGVPALLAGMRAPRFLGPAAERFNAVFPDAAAAHGVPLYPFFLDGVAGRPGLTLADGVHPNAAAVRIVAERIAPHVLAALTAPA